MRALPLLLLLAGCAGLGPYERAGQWQPSGANAANLAAMVSNPADLLHGHGDPGPQSRMATDAAIRLLNGTAKPLGKLSADADPNTGGGPGGPGPAPTPAPPAAPPAPAASGDN